MPGVQEGGQIMLYIIMAGGTYPFWKTPKQLLEIDGEPIIERTIRLLRENGVEDIVISSNNDIFEQFKWFRKLGYFFINTNVKHVWIY